uniref:ANK_REP_REGION domain-containing protein n=1 Tax=Steinernema glaseri TaxID=37863 RepID=A0A1I8ATV9_9BILA
MLSFCPRRFRRRYRHRKATRIDASISASRRLTQSPVVTASMAEEEDHTYSDKNQCSSSHNSLMGVRSIADSDNDSSSNSEDSYVEDDIEDEIFISDLDEESYELRRLDRSLEPYRHLLPVLSTLSNADKVQLQTMLYRVGITAALSVSNFLEFESPNSPPLPKEAMRPLQMLEDRYMEKHGKDAPLGPFGPHLVSMLFKYGIFDDCSEMVSQIREKMGELMGSGQLPKSTITENVENDIAAASLAAVSTSLHRNPPTHQLEMLMTAASHESSTQACSETDSTSTCSKNDEDDSKEVYKGGLASPITLTDGLIDPLPLDEEYDRIGHHECDDDDLDDDDDDDDDESDIDTSSLLHSIEDEEAGMMNQDYLLRFAAVMGYNNLLKTLVKLGNTEFGTCRYSSPLLEASAAGQPSSVETLLQHGADANACTEQGNTPLIFACAIGKIEIVKALLEVKSVDVFKRNLHGHDCLMEAACAGHIDIVKYLTENVYNEQYGKGKVLHLTEGEKETALTLAAYKGFTEIVKYLLTQYIPSKQELYIALTETSIDGHFEIAKILMEHGAPVNMKTETFDSPLSMAAGSGHADLVRLLIEKGADIEQVNDDQYTPLMESCREGHIELVKILVTSGVKLDQITPNSETALTLAAAHGSLPIVQLLLENGASIFLGSPSALYEATQEGHKDVVQFLVHRLLELRASHTKEVNEDLNKAFLISVDMNHREIAEILASTGVNLDYIGKDGRTALMNACRLGHLPIVKYLIERGASVNVEMPGKDATALSLSALHGYPEIVQTLLDAGADPSALLRDSSTCILEAARHGHTACVEILLSHHAKHQTPVPKASTPVISSGNSSTTSTANRSATTTTTPSSCTHHNDNGMQKLPAHGPACSQMHSLPGHPAGIGTCQHYNHSRTSAGLRAARQRKSNKPPAAHGRDCPFHGCGNSHSDETAHLPLSPASYTDLQNYHHVQAAIAAGRSLMTRGREPITDEQVKQFTDAVSRNISGQGLAEAFEKPPFGDSCTDSQSHDLSHIPDPPRMKSASGGVKRKSSGSKDNEIHCAHVTSGPTKASNVAMPPLSSEKSILAHGAQLTTKEIQEMFKYGVAPPPPALAAAVSACGFDPVTSSGTVTLSRNTSCNHQTEVKKHTHTFTATGKGKLPTASISITATTGPCPKDVKNVKGKRTVKNTKDMQKLKELQLQSQKAQEKRRNTSDVADIIDVQTESNHDTALTLACAGGYPDLVDLLIRKGADVEHRDKKGFTPLVLAATGGHVECVKHLLDASCLVDAVSERTKDTALSLACSGGRKEVVEILLKANANKEHRNVSDYTPLSLAASGGYIEIIQLLLNAGAEINSRTGSKLCISPLMLAAMNGHEAATKMLLERGSDINAHIETNRNTALTLACFQGRVEVVRLLLKYNANVEHRAKTGLTPLMEAANGGYSAVGKLLLEAGADPNAPPVPSSRDTALTIAADKGHYQFVDLLICHGANINARNKKGCTAVWLACNGGHLETLKTLVVHKADVDLQDSRKTSPLMTAFRKGHLKIIRYLVKHVQQFPGDAECYRFLQAFTEKDKELEERCRQCLSVILTAKERQAAQAEAAAQSLLEQLAEEQEQAASRKRSKQLKNEEKRAKRLAKKAEEQEAARLKELAAKEEAEAKRKAKEETKKKVVEKVVLKKDDEPLREEMIEEQAEESIPTIEKEELPLDEKEPELPQSELLVSAFEALQTEKPDETVEKIEEWTEVASIGSEKKPVEVAAVASVRGRRSNRKEATKLTTANGASKTVVTPAKSESESEWCKAGSNKKKVAVGKPVTKSTTSGSVKSGEVSDDGGVWNNIESSKRRQQVMNLASSHIARVIGRGGVNINAIREATNANIEVEKQISSRNQGPRNITIKGNSEAVKNAVLMIEVLLKEADLTINQIVSRVLNKHSSSPSQKSLTSTELGHNEQGSNQNDNRTVQGASNVWEQRAAIRHGLQKDDTMSESLSQRTGSSAAESHPPPVRSTSPVSSFTPSVGTRSVGCPSPGPAGEEIKPDSTRVPSPDDFNKRKAPGSERTSNAATPVTNGEQYGVSGRRTHSPINVPHSFTALDSQYPRNVSPAPQEVPNSRVEPPPFSSVVDNDVNDILPRFSSMSVFKAASNKDENELAANLFAPESKLCDIWGNDRHLDVSANLANRLGNGGVVDPMAAVWMNGGRASPPSTSNQYAKEQQLPERGYGYNRSSFHAPSSDFTPWSDGSNMTSTQEWGSRASVQNRQSNWETLIPGGSSKFASSSFGASSYEHNLNRQTIPGDVLRPVPDSYDMTQKIRNESFQSAFPHSAAPHQRMNQPIELRRAMYSNPYDSAPYAHQQPNINTPDPFDAFSPADRSSALYYNQAQMVQPLNRQSFRSSPQTQSLRSGSGMSQAFGNIGDVMHPSTQSQNYRLNSPSPFYMQQQQTESSRVPGALEQVPYGMGSASQNNAMYSSWSTSAPVQSQQNQIWSNGSSGPRNIW